MMGTALQATEGPEIVLPIGARVGPWWSPPPVISIRASRRMGAVRELKNRPATRAAVRDAIVARAAESAPSPVRADARKKSKLGPGPRSAPSPAG
jgi:hypothetical protein